MSVCFTALPPVRNTQPPPRAAPPGEYQEEGPVPGLCWGDLLQGFLTELL